jgi:hypothetical protein
MKNQSTQNMLQRTVLTAINIVLDASGGATLAQENAEQVSPEQARGNFGRQIVLAPDDARAFPDAPTGFDKSPTNGISGRTEVFEYDSKVTGARRKAVVFLPPDHSADHFAQRIFR